MTIKGSTRAFGSFCAFAIMGSFETVRSVVPLSTWIVAMAIMSAAWCICISIEERKWD